MKLANKKLLAVDRQLWRVTMIMKIWNIFISPLNNNNTEKYVEFAMKNLYANNEHHNTIIKWMVSQYKTFSECWDKILTLTKTLTKMKIMRIFTNCKWFPVCCILFLIKFSFHWYIIYQKLTHKNLRYLQKNVHILEKLKENSTKITETCAQEDLAI